MRSGYLAVALGLMLVVAFSGCLGNNNYTADNTTSGDKVDDQASVGGDDVNTQPTGGGGSVDTQQPVDAVASNNEPETVASEVATQMDSELINESDDVEIGEMI